MTNECEVCALQQRMEHRDDPWSVARLQTGYVQLNRFQFFRGYTFFSSRDCVREVFELSAETRALHLHEMVEVNLDYLRLVWTGDEDDASQATEARVRLLAELRTADVVIEQELT